MAEHATLLVDIFFTSPDRGWVVGGKASVPNPTRDDVKPVVLFTEDGGQTWVNRVANLQAEFPLGEWGWKIQFLDQRIGFISLESFRAGAILKTTDGGLTWTRKVINDAQSNANLEGIGFIDENHGWVGGWAPPISKAASAAKPQTAEITGRMRITSAAFSTASGSSAIR